MYPTPPEAGDTAPMPAAYAVVYPLPRCGNSLNEKERRTRLAAAAVGRSAGVPFGQGCVARVSARTLAPYGRFEI